MNRLELDIGAALSGSLPIVMSHDSEATGRPHRRIFRPGEYRGAFRTYRGGPPPLRLRRMQHHQEGRARAAGVFWEMVDLRDVYTQCGGRCGICREPVEFDTFTIDHVVPFSKGGHHLRENLQPAHRSCNSKKGNKVGGAS